MTIKTTAIQNPCHECGRTGRYNLYGRWFCTQHRGLAEKYAVLPDPKFSWINAGDQAPAVLNALVSLSVPGVQPIENGIVLVLVPEGTNPDEHQDALTSLANAITGR